MWVDVISSCQTIDKCHHEVMIQGMFAPNLDIVDLRPVYRGTPELGKFKRNCRAISTSNGMPSTLSRPDAAYFIFRCFAVLRRASP